MDVIKWIAIAAVSTIAIIGTRIMSKAEPENRWFAWYATAINFLMIAVCFFVT